MGERKRGRPPGSGTAPHIVARVRYLYEYEGLGPKAIENRLMPEFGAETPGYGTIKKQTADLVRGAKVGLEPWDFLDATPEERRLIGEYLSVEWLARTVTGAMPHGSRISPDGRRHYSCAMMSDELFEIDTRTFEVLRVLELNDGKAATGAEDGHGHGGEGGLKLSKTPNPVKPTWVDPHPIRPVAYVALNGAAQVVEVDLESWAITRRFPTAPGPYNLMVSEDGKRMVVSYKTAGAVGIWDLELNEEIARIPATRKVTHGVTISPDNRYAFVSNEAVGGQSGTLDVIDLTNNELVASVELGLQPGGITFWKIQKRIR